MNKQEAIDAIATALGVSGQAYNHEGWGKKLFSYRADDKTPSASFNFISGNVKDFGGEVVTFKTLCERFNIDYVPDERYEVASTKIEYTDLDHYARTHALTGEQLAEFGVSWTTKPARHNDWKETPCILFQTNTGDRWKFMDGSGEWAVNTGTKP
jgi:hypothetical protein